MLLDIKVITLKDLKDPVIENPITNKALRLRLKGQQELLQQTLPPTRHYLQFIVVKAHDQEDNRLLAFSHNLHRRPAQPREAVQPHLIGQTHTGYLNHHLSNPMEVGYQIRCVR